jgi:hypothetical protein
MRRISWVPVGRVVTIDPDFPGGQHLGVGAMADLTQFTAAKRRGRPLQDGAGGRLGSPMGKNRARRSISAGALWMGSLLNQ